MRDETEEVNEEFYQDTGWDSNCGLSKIKAEGLSHDIFMLVESIGIQCWYYFERNGAGTGCFARWI
jgi:hypothetical protein